MNKLIERWKIILKHCKEIPQKDWAEAAKEMEEEYDNDEMYVDEDEGGGERYEEDDDDGSLDSFVPAVN